MRPRRPVTFVKGNRPLLSISIGTAVLLVGALLPLAPEQSRHCTLHLGEPLFGVIADAEEVFSIAASHRDRALGLLLLPRSFSFFLHPAQRPFYPTSEQRIGFQLLHTIGTLRDGILASDQLVRVDMDMVHQYFALRHEG